MSCFYYVIHARVHDVKTAMKSAIRPSNRQYFKPLDGKMFRRYSKEAKREIKWLKMLLQVKFVTFQTLYSLEALRTKFRMQQTSKFLTYKDLNPGLGVHSLYTYPDSIHDLPSDSFQQVPSLGTPLEETGRWPRTPRAFRVGPCDNVSIQDENHVMFTVLALKNSKLEKMLMQWYILGKTCLRETIEQSAH